MGASGAVFGMYGCLLGHMARSCSRLPSTALTQIAKNGFIFLGFNIVYGVIQTDIDMAAYLDGLAAGCLCRLAMSLPLDPTGVSYRLQCSLILSIIGGEVLGHVAKHAVKPIPDAHKELKRFEHIKPNVLRAFKKATVQVQWGEISDAQCAKIADRQVLRPWRVVQESLSRVEGFLELLKEVGRLLKRYMEVNKNSFVAVMRLAQRGDERIIEDIKRTRSEADKLIGEMKALK